MSNNLQDLEIQLKEELQSLEYPPPPWLTPTPKDIHDVIIIGGGMAGLAAAFGLMREGIPNVQVIDASPEGYEGPWDTYARMLTLRSPKFLAGPALGISNLTFQAWYIAQFGNDAWEQLYKIPTKMWMDYLRWYRKVLAIPVKNNQTVVDIAPGKGFIQLTFANGELISARKVVLATGRSGFGGAQVPAFAEQLPKTVCAHTNESIDFGALKGKNICIIGTGASAFDAAAAALEHEASTVMMLMRRKSIPCINKLASVYYRGFTLGYPDLADQAKVNFLQHAFEMGSTPPFESLDRVKSYPNFTAAAEVHIQKIAYIQNKLVLTTDKGLINCDFLILATGFLIDGSKQKELSSIYGHLLLWKDRLPDLSKRLGNYPYLGKHYQFLEKIPESAPFLRDIYCFNYAAILSHGLTTGDIPEIGSGASKLAKGIAADFFTQDWHAYLKRLKEYEIKEFLISDYAFLQKDNGREWTILD